MECSKLIFLLFAENEIADQRQICIPNCRVFGCPKDLVCNEMNFQCETPIPCSPNCPPGMSCANETCHYFECYSNEVCMLLNKKKDICLNGKCVPGQTKCTGNSCPEGFQCKNGFCCPKPKNNACPLGEMMSNNECIPRIICDIYQKCPHNMVCQNNICEEMVCPETRCPPFFTCDELSQKCRSVQCTSSSDCIGLDECDKINNICVPPCEDCLTCGVPCPYGFRCNGKMCQWRTRCNTFLDCRELERCPVDNQCSQVECMDDTGCEAGKPYCIFGMCSQTPKCLAENKQCKSFGESNSCIEGVCYGFKFCTGNEECKKNEYCDEVAKLCIPKYKSYGKCPVDMEYKPDLGYCTALNCSANNAQCSKNRMCMRDFCVVFQDTNCTKGIMKNGECYKKCKENKCSECGDTCKTGCECRQNMCTCIQNCTSITECPPQRYCDIDSKNCILPPCFTAADCKPKEVCVFGTCTLETVNSCDVVCDPKYKVREEKSSDTCRWNRCLPKELNPCPDFPCQKGFTCDPVLKICFPLIICDKDSDCVFPAICDNNLCKLIQPPRCPEPLELVNGEICLPRISCNHKTDCGKLENCVEKVCKPFCSTTKDCKMGEICSVTKICVPPKPCNNCTVAEFCLNDICNPLECLLDDDCPREKPHCILGICSRPYPKCSHFCKPCINNMCFERCQHCLEGQKCEKGLCVGYDIRCISKCPPGMICKNGLCKVCSLTDNCGLKPECKNCTDNQVCIRGECTTICNSNSDCSSGICKNRICKKPSPCPCSVGEFCANRVCIAPQCFRDSDCNDNSFCYLGHCFTNIKGCLSDDDCMRDSEKCENDVCVKSGCQCQPNEKCFKNLCHLETICFTDYDCPNGLSCNEQSHTCTLTDCKKEIDCRSKHLTCPDDVRNCRIKPECRSDSDCDANYQCSKSLGRCILKIICYEPGVNGAFSNNCSGTQGCSTNFCPANYICVNDVCLKQTECPCEAPLVCKEPGGYCILPKCRGDADCLFNQRCNNGECHNMICRDDSECSDNKKCQQGICVDNPPMCPCSKNEYCNSMRKCKPRRACNPYESACDYTEACQCTDTECFCSDVSCRNKPEICIAPDFCDPETFTCRNSDVCYSNQDCSRGKCCDLQLQRCFPCCKYPSECMEHQSCLKGACITIAHTTPEVYCNKYNGCTRIECTLHSHCSSKQCFYGMCLDEVESCENCKYDCYKGLCLHLKDPWKVLREIKQNTTDPTSQNCKDGLCIPLIICYIDQHCPPNTECDGRYCDFKNCSVTACEPPFKCSDTSVCLPDKVCHSDIDCKKNEICIRGKCYTSCSETECPASQRCSLFWPKKGICTIDKKCSPEKPCPRGYYCSVKNQCEFPPPSCPIGYGLIGGICDRITGCRTDEDCAENQICSLFKAIADRRICITSISCQNKDCLPGLFCYPQKSI